MDPELPFAPKTPPEILAAAKAITTTAEKWGKVADTADQSLQVGPVVLAIGIVLGFLFGRLWASK